MSSFQALTELRRVSGTQLDRALRGGAVGAARGPGVEYRHADKADFDRELDLERRIGAAVEDPRRAAELSTRAGQATLLWREPPGVRRCSSERMNSSIASRVKRRWPPGVR